jgi:hypothetical protein
MAEHTVKVRLPKRVEVFSKDLDVEVRRNGSIIGNLKISKGSLDWRDVSDRNYYRSLKWEKFAELAKDHGSKKPRS